MNLIIILIILFAFWCMCNYITILFVNKYGESNEVSISAYKYRKNIMFDILALIFFFIFDINFIKWIGIIYYVIISIIEGILLVVSIITGLDEDIKNKKVDRVLWSLVLVKLLNELSSIIMIVALFEILN